MQVSIMNLRIKTGHNNKVKKKVFGISLSHEYLICIIELRREELFISLSCEYLIYTIKQNLLYTQIIEICNQVVSVRFITY